MLKVIKLWMIKYLKAFSKNCKSLEDLFSFNAKNNSKFLKSLNKMEIKNIKEESEQSERMFKEDIQDGTSIKS